MFTEVSGGEGLPKQGTGAEQPQGQKTEGYQPPVKQTLKQRFLATRLGQTLAQFTNRDQHSEALARLAGERAGSSLERENIVDSTSPTGETLTDARITNLSRINSEVIHTHPFRILIPGLFGGGRQLTASRDYLHAQYGQDIYIPSSLLSREGHQRGEGVRKHFERLSQEILERASGKDLEFIVHSGGGHEVVDLLNKVLTKENPDVLNGKHISINFISTPGLTGKGLENIIATVRNLQHIGKDATTLEQHMLYPLPEAYYTQAISVRESPISEVEDVFVDSPQQRTERQDTFLQNWLPHLPIDQIEKQRISNALIETDKQISQAITSGISPETLLEQREAILAPLLQDVFHGKHINEETHSAFLQKYQETANSLASLPRYYLNFLLYIAHIGRRIDRGMGQAIAKLIEKGRTKGVDIKIVFTFLGRDLMLPPEQINALKQTVTSNQIGDAVDGYYFAEQYAHSTLGYHPELLANIFGER